MRPSGRAGATQVWTKFAFVVLSSLAPAGNSKGQHDHQRMNYAHWHGRHWDSAMSRPGRLCPRTFENNAREDNAGVPMPPGRWHRRHASATSPRRSRCARTLQLEAPRWAHLASESAVPPPAPPQPQWPGVLAAGVRRSGI